MRFAFLYPSRRKRGCDEEIVVVFPDTCVSTALEVGEQYALLGRSWGMVFLPHPAARGVFSKLKFARSSHKGPVVQNCA